jgi:polyhydroxyalkanoate synthase subunit PhaC
MTGDSKIAASLDPVVLAERFQALASKSQAAVQGFLLDRPDVVNIGMGDPAAIGQAFLELTTKLMADPRPIARAQIELWEQSVSLWARTWRHLLGGEPPPAGAPDKRFKYAEWAENPIFSYIRDSYLLSARAVLSAVRDVKGLDEETSRKVEFYTKQFVDALAPSNFMATNPEVLTRTIETGGDNLLSGLTNLLDDLQRGKGRLSVTMTDMNAFRLGENIANTPGKVVFQNEMIQLIQYTAMTEQVHKTPLLIIPPWINKFYVLDLQPKNSFIRWCVGQGHTVFVISWINPDGRLRDKSFEHYMLEGPIAAMAAIEQAAGERAVNCVGYCLGGTLLASTLAYLAAKGDDRVKSATYFVTLVDFVESGDMSVFIDTDQLKSLEARMNEKGYLDAQDMATSFNMLRANDLIWSFVVGNYLLGKEPVPFDLLYWNSDATRMPAAMHSFYLRNMYQENNLAKPGGVTLDGVPIDLRKITTPTFILGTKEDHIAPWKSAYRATQFYGGPVEFVLSASGHMAGVISAPGSKYSHWTNSSNPATADEWFKTATEGRSSWWPHWNAWVTKFSVEQVAARTPGEGLSVIEDAPGSYVRVRSDA